MKTLFRKDLRENFKLALIGLGIFTLLVVMTVRSCSNSLEQLALGEMSNESDNRLHPLLAEGFQMTATFFCAIFGAALGWFQTRNEAHRDLWAFLVHRPITRTQIFWGKTAAGLCLYSLGAGLPLLGMVGYVALPGAFAAPFEPAMALPLFAIFLTGFAYYFAGLLTGLRQARWFGSRTFGLGAAILTSSAAYGPTEFWQTALLTIVAAAIIGVAAWGAYQSGGFYRGQPVFGRLSLTLLLAVGSFFVLAALVFITEAVVSHNPGYRWRNYVTTKDGQIYIQTSYQGKETFTDLNGKPVIDPATGQPLTRKKFEGLRAQNIGAYAGPLEMGNEWEQRYNADTKFFTLWNVSAKTLWYVDRHGKLMGFNGVTHGRVGDIVPHEAGGDAPFIRSAHWNNDFSAYNPPSILCTASAVYRVNLDDGKLSPIFTATPGDPIVGFTDQSYFPQALVLTRGFIHLLHRDGSNVLALPYALDSHSYPSIDVSRLEDSTNSFAVWFHPDYRLNEKADWKMPIHVSWTSPESQVTRSLDLPVLRDPSVETLFDKILTAVTPPALQWVDEDDGHYRVRLPNTFSLILAALCALIAWRLVRRYHFAARPAAGWVVFVLLFGIPALLAFSFAQEWPKREPCPKCGKLRTVDREHCEHCGAPFAPPDKIGIEIFESVTT